MCILPHHHRREVVKHRHTDAAGNTNILVPSQGKTPNHRLAAELTLRNAKRVHLVSQMTIRAAFAAADVSLLWLMACNRSERTETQSFTSFQVGFFPARRRMRKSAKCARIAARSAGVILYPPCNIFIACSTETFSV